MSNPKERLPAKQSKCPHCNWVGSSRGLFSHVRLTHPGMEASLKIRTENPYVIKNNTVGSVKKRKRFDTGENAIPKFNLEDAKTVLFMTAFVKLLNEYIEMDDELMFPNRSYKLNSRK